SDTMTIGDITALGVSDEIAFRAEFAGELPKAADRYWRGPVLWETDGRTWQTGEAGVGSPHPVIKRGLEYHYSVLLEPTGERWLLGLDAVTHTGRSAAVQADQSLRSKNAIKRRLRYQLSSATSYGLLEITPRERAAALALPRHRHPKAIELARTWAAEISDPNAIVARALEYLVRNRFTYTLLPPALPGDSVDQFLFETRTGFCEHFAAAFTILLRAAEIPARVVTGYQGGEFNDVSDYLTIRQRDAHAWVEAYLPRQGWIRVDPTAVVAPSRVAQGIASFATDRSPLRILDRDGAAFKAWRSAAAWWDAMNFEWAQWVLGYSPQRQIDFFQGLGWDDVDPGDLMFGLTGAIATVLGVLAVITLRRCDGRDPIDRAYAMYCRKLARIRFMRAPYEGPLHYARRVSASRPDLRADVEQITALYTALRYADAKLDSRLLTRRVRAFSPRSRDSQPSV
ncbi:MAG: transglutaminase TgpA family protein, partial [Gammaproteobacteria bacterium]